MLKVRRRTDGAVGVAVRDHYGKFSVLLLAGGHSYWEPAHFDRLFEITGYLELTDPTGRAA